MSECAKFTSKQEEAWTLLDSLVSDILLYGGSRSGKTFIICYYIVTRALMFGNTDHLIFRKFLTDLYSSIISTTLPSVCRAISDSLYDYIYESRGNYNRQRNFITLPNNSRIWLSGCDDRSSSKDKILGNEYSTIFGNEMSQIHDYELITTLKTRLSQTVCLNKLIVDCNPPSKSHWIYRKYIEKKDPIDRLPVNFNSAYLLMNPVDNQINLPENYIKETLSGLSKRQQDRFKEGLFQSDIVGALWSCDLIESSRKDAPPSSKWQKIAVAVDPSGTSNKRSDECGIIVGCLANGHAFVLEDLSGIYSPDQWAQKAIWAYHKYEANYIVAEVNQGADMVETIIHQIDPHVPVMQVRATKGKAIRADAVVALYEQNKIWLTKIFDDLEDQMTGWTPESSKSPDRLDAMVWLVYALIIHHEQYRIF